MIKYTKNNEEVVEITCGIFKIIERLNEEIEKKIYQQTVIILNLVYEFHYSLKNLFLLYLNVNNLLFQSILNSLHICFFMDLGMVYENKYDLNIFSSLLQERCDFTTK